MTQEERIEKRSNEFDLEDFFKRIETSKDIYDNAIVCVITNDKTIYRVDLREHINAASKIYRSLYHDFIDFKENIMPNSEIWEKEAIRYGDVVILMSKYNKLFIGYTPEDMNDYQINTLKDMNDLANKYNIKAELSINGNDTAIRLNDYIENLDTEKELTSIKR